MPTDTPASFDLKTTYIHLADSAPAHQVPVDANFWATIHERSELADGRLVMKLNQSADWPHWEMHPAGDEVLYLISGEMELILDENGQERHVPFKAGSAFIVPRGIWHRALVHEPGELIGITRGAGTQTRPL